LAHAKAETEENSVRRQVLLLSLDLVVKDITAVQGLNIKIMMVLFQVVLVIDAKREIFVL